MIISVTKQAPGTSCLVSFELQDKRGSWITYRAEEITDTRGVFSLELDPKSSKEFEEWLKIKREENERINKRSEGK